MTWSLTNLIIQIIAGFLGGHVAAIVFKEHDFGVIGHSLTGLVGGALSGYFLQTLAITMVTGPGTLIEPRFGEQVVIEFGAGAAAGAVLTLLVGFLKHTIAHSKAQKS
jgi:uncharacterized membrane protein YeaQ/YmgE (transglycosylase-associated protein family)